jgi:hypothetical protein
MQLLKHVANFPSQRAILSIPYDLLRDNSPFDTPSITHGHNYWRYRVPFGRRIARPYRLLINQNNAA